MIYLKILIALITFLMLVVSRFEGDFSDSQSNEGSSLGLIEFTRLDSELLPVEKAWFDAEKVVQKAAQVTLQQEKAKMSDKEIDVINCFEYKCPMKWTKLKKI